MTYPRLFVALIALASIAGHLPAQEKPGREQRPDSQERIPEEPAAQAREATVALLESGEEPRQQLRYQIGETEPVVLSIKSTRRQQVMGMNPPPTRSPELRFHLRSETTVDEDKENLNSAFRFTKVEVAADQAPTRQLEAAKRAAAPAEGREARLVLSNRGHVRSLKLPLRLGASDPIQTGDLATDLQDALWHAVVALPEEPVGKGAKWRVEAVTDAFGVAGRLSAEYTVLHIDGNHIELALKSTHEVTEEKTLTSSRASETTLQSMKKSGEGTLTISTSSVLPLKLDLSETTEMEIAIKGRAGTFVMNQTVESQTLIAPAPVEAERGEESVDREQGTGTSPREQ